MEKIIQTYQVVMKNISTSFDYLVVEENELDISDKEVLLAAKLATQRAYAPYSNFKVGAAARLSNGQLVLGTNQENASFPAGICAERVLFAGVMANNPNDIIETLAISYHSENKKSDHPISPCGICRQVMAEYEINSGKEIKLLLSGMTGKIFIITALKNLLPLSFTKNDLIS